MDWLMVFFFGIVTYPLLFISYYVMKSESKRKESRYFGVTVPKEYWQDERFAEIIADYKRRMKLNIILLAVLPIPFFLFVRYFSILYMVWSLWMFLMLGLLYAPFVWANRKVKNIKQKENWQFADEEKGADDADRYWKWGLLYHNPNDKQGTVTARVGIGVVVNMAKPWAKVLLIFSFVIMLAVPVMAGVMIAEEFTPIYLECDGQTVTAGQLKDNYKISIADIEEVELTTDVLVMSKKTGGGMSNLYKGTYHVRNVGDFETLFHPMNQYVLYIRTTDGLYYLGDADDEGTKEVYDQIMEAR